MYSKEANIRKQQSILICSGIAMIFFGVWSIIRIFLMRFIDPDHFIDYMNVMEITDGVDYINFVLVVTLAFMLIDLFVRIYIGVSAIREGRGKLKKRVTYIVVAIVCLTLALCSDVAEIFSLVNEEFASEIFLTTIIDISIHIATLEVIVSAIRIRKLLKD